ncbi:Eukaryotic translation initiation factor 2D [Rhynchospora pubera]|uniref:Eukaryotic translation initiation factor 2D n=1 Tax=Rhynchospora pubera TaxID=906938 RepID=A0AAV8D0A9_9POAL|nr:Eukaryotic translation initiation factor 2D [Rhynchospora pubera]
MFKKAVDVKALQRLSGADKKKLRRTAKERFPQASDADVDALLPPKADIMVSKYPNRLHVYSIEGGFPMLFDIDGRGSEIYPTVYALWVVPELLPSFLLKGGEVSRYVLGGADLMFPGIFIQQEGLPNFAEGEPYSVRVPGNPAPIAVGATTMTSAQAMKASLRGKALRILHHYRDCLWDSVEARYVPNAGFLEDVVFGDPNLSQPPADDLSDVIEENVEEETELLSVGYQMAEAAEELTAGVSNVLKVSESAIEEDKSKEEKEEHVMTIEEIDALLDKCLLQALHTSVKDKDLPIPGSTLWSHHVLPSRPSGTTLDIKKSSHKKLSKWLQSKASAGLISAKEDKHKKEMMLLGINRGHPDYTSFRPEKRPKEPTEQRDTTNPSPNDATHDGKSQLEVVEIYKPTTHVNPIFVSLGADTSRYYSASEASDVVFSYVEKENLVKPTDKSKVVLDAILCDALYKGAIKKGGAYPAEIHKRDIGQTFVGRMQIHHHVARGSDSVLRKGAIKSIQIMTERRQGNKKVTRVSGLESFLLDADSLASELQKKFACSTTVAELPGKKGHEVLVQGGVIDDLARHLVEHYGIPKRYIEVLDKTKK